MYERATQSDDHVHGDFMLSAKIVYEDENILIYYKSVNQTAQGAQSQSENLTDGLVNYLKHKGEYDPRTQKIFSPSFINRLDTNTQGLMFGVKNYVSARKYAALLREGKIKKYYTALLCGVAPKKGTYQAFHLKDTRTKTAWIGQRAKPGAKTHCHDDYRRGKQSGFSSLQDFIGYGKVSSNQSAYGLFTCSGSGRQ